MTTRPATEAEKCEASWHIGMCQDIPVDIDGAVHDDAFDIAPVKHWSNSVDKRNEDGLWCKPTCTDGVHFCPESPAPCDSEDWIDGGEGVKIAQYAYDMSNGAQFPPIVVIQRLDGSYAVEDGYHRISALLMLGRKTTAAVVLPEID